MSILLKYRTTPHPSTGQTPSTVMFGRELQTRLTLLQPNELERLEKSIKGKDGTRSFEPDDSVWLRNYSGNPKWIPGTIVTKTGPVSFKVESKDQIYKRHVDQIRRRLVNTDEKDSSKSPFISLSTNEQ